MADEQAQEVVPQEEQPIVETPSVSEDVKPQEDHDAGDLRIALKQEREKRKEFEAKFNDPDFILQKAEELGLTEKEVEEVVAPQPYNPNDVESVVERTLKIREAQAKYPDLKSDEEAQLMVSALMNKGLDPLAAADKFYARYTKADEAVKAAQEAKEVVTAKENATTAQPSAPTGAATVELEKLQQDAKSLDPRVQRQAMERLIAMKLKQK